MEYERDTIKRKAKKSQGSQQEWLEIEELVMQYQRQFAPDVTDEEKERGKNAAAELLQRFMPLMKKYITILKTGHINFNDKQVKKFVRSFIDDMSLVMALRRRKQRAEYRNKIYQKFNFIKETYGVLPEDEMLVNFQILLLSMAKRYKQVGKSFCGYVYNTFMYEVVREIKKYIHNPLNIPYKNLEYEEYMKANDEEEIVNSVLEDKFYETSMGIPDMHWIIGKGCSELFSDLTTLERKILVKYYLENWNDKQIAADFGIHINTVNQHRRNAVYKIAQKLNINPKSIKRSRNSGKRAVTSPILEY